MRTHSFTLFPLWRNNNWLFWNCSLKVQIINKLSNIPWNLFPSPISLVICFRSTLLIRAIFSVMQLVLYTILHITPSYQIHIYTFTIHNSHYITNADKWMDREIDSKIELKVELHLYVGVWHTCICAFFYQCSFNIQYDSSNSQPVLAALTYFYQSEKRNHEFISIIVILPYISILPFFLTKTPENDSGCVCLILPKIL